MTIEHPTAQQCHSCSAHLEHRLYCGSCEKIQQLGKGDDYFTIFEHPRQFKLDEAVVEQAFETLIMALHPDFYATAEPTEQALSLEHTALLHEAKNALFNPYLRGRYLLSLLVPELGASTSQPPQDFLIQTFEWQETLEQAQTSGGDLSGVEQVVSGEQQTVEDSLETQFQQLETYADQEELVEAIGANLGKLKFLLKLQERINDIKKNR